MKILLQGYPYMNTDSKVSVSLPQAMWDGYCEVNADFVLRPGLTRALSMITGYGTRGLFWWESQRTIVVFNGGRTYLVDPTTYVITDITGAGIDTTRTAWVSWCDLGASFAAAAGEGVIRFTAGDAATTFDVLPGAPTLATSVAFHDDYLLANQTGTQEMRYLALTGGVTWSTVSAEGKPDNITAVKSRDAEIYLFGPDSIEFWWNDGVTPFSRQAGASGRISEGCISPNTIEDVDGDWYWLTSSREIVQLVGRELKVLSIPIQAILDAYTTVEDAKAFQLRIGGKGFYGIHFPTHNVTWVYDYQIKGWVNWSFYNTGTRSRQSYLGSLSCYLPYRGKWLLGSIDNDRLYLADTSVGTDDGVAIHGEKISGWNDSGISHRKLYKNLQIQLTTGMGTLPTDAAIASYMYKNDGDRHWHEPLNIEIANIGSVNHVSRITNVGSGRLRQHRMRCAGGYPITVAQLTQDTIDLGR